jgi:predicted dehydrogenase
MHFAFIGSEHEWQRLKAWFEPASEHRVLAVLASPASEPWAVLPPGATRCNDFEELLSNPQIDGLILGGPVCERAARLRRAAQAGRTCLCFMPLDATISAYHEVAMIAVDTGAVLLPMLPGPVHPAWRELESVCRSGSLGTIRTVTVERSVADDARGELISGLYAEAADLLGRVIGEIIEVIATGDLTGGRLHVHHRAASGATAEVRLLTGAAGSDRWSFMVEAERGRAAVSFPEGLLGPGSLRWGTQTGPRETTLVPGPHDNLIAELARARAGQTHTPQWQDAVRAAELADCVWISLQRRRSVDVYHERASELARFKGLMTSCGCGLIWLTLAVLIIVAAGEALGFRGISSLLFAVPVVWVLFAVLQALRWLLPRNGSPPTGVQDPGTRSSSLKALVALLVVLFVVWLVLRLLFLGGR